MKMQQCDLKKRLGEIRSRIITAWIPCKFAEKGKFVAIKDDDGNWDDGWEVISVGSTLEARECMAQSNYHRTHRKGSDI